MAMRLGCKLQRLLAYKIDTCNNKKLTLPIIALFIKQNTFVLELVELKKLVLISFAFYYLLLLLTGVPSSLIEKKISEDKVSLHSINKEDSSKALLLLSFAFEEEENAEQLTESSQFLVLSFLYQLVFQENKQQDHFAYYEDLNISPYKVSLFVLDRDFRI